MGLHADGTRTTLEDQPAELTPGEPKLSGRSVVVVSGGARGVTADTVVASCMERSLESVVGLLGIRPITSGYASISRWFISPKGIRPRRVWRSIARSRLIHKTKPPSTCESGFGVNHNRKVYFVCQGGSMAHRNQM